MASFIKPTSTSTSKGNGTLKPGSVTLCRVPDCRGIHGGPLEPALAYPIALLVWSAAGVCDRLRGDSAPAANLPRDSSAQARHSLAGRRGVVRRIMPREAQPFANGVFNSGMTLGAVLTPILVIAMVGPHGEGWRRLFAIVVPQARSGL